LTRLLNGLLFSNLTLAPQRPGIDYDPVDTVDRLISAILQDPASKPLGDTPT